MNLEGTFDNYLNIKDFNTKKIEIDNIKMSNRLRNRLTRKGIKLIEDLLPYTMQDMYEIDGFGKSCEVELRNLLDVYKQDNENNELIDGSIFPYVENIKMGDFSFLELLEDSNLSDLVNLYKRAYEETDTELLRNCIDFPLNNIKYYEMLRNYNKKVEDYLKIVNSLKTINPLRLNNKVLYYIEAYTDDIEIQAELEEISVGKMTLGEYARLVYRNKELSEKAIYINFLKWCTYDISNEVKELIDNLKKNERTYQIVCARAEKKTLEQIGTSLNVTRERIRQIEQKAIKNFQIWRKNKRILKKIFADCNGERILDRQLLKEVIGENYYILFYFLKNDTAENVVYSKAFDSFAIGCDYNIDDIQVFVDSLGKKIDQKLLDIILDDAVKIYGFDEKLLKTTINTTYRFVGETYYKGNLTLESIYEEVLKKYYKNGIHVYDSEELYVFKQRVYDEFNINIFDKTDRSVASTIGRIGLLCGRGEYCYKDEQSLLNMSQVLHKIYSYIRDSEHTVFLVNTLFYVFEKELAENNIVNRYHLQGVLKEKYGNKWFFTKDYISKDDKMLSVYPSIVNCVKKYNHPISKEILLKEFPGVSDIVFSFALSDSNILHYFGSYFHVDNISISENEKEYIKQVIESTLGEEGYVHCSKIYDVIYREHKTILTNNYVKYVFDLFVYLEYLYGTEYHFSRPFISRQNVKIDNSDTILKGIVQEEDRISISEVISFAREHSFVLNSILDFLDSCNETHLIINSKELMRIELTGLNNENINEILKLLENEVDSTVAISSLSCISRFPKINIEWTDWLIYSIVKKWSKSLETIPSSSQYRQSIPLIAPIGKASAQEYVDTGISNTVVVVLSISKKDMNKCNYNK